MLNFTVGPVQMSDEICELGKNQVPYFRTSEFSEVMKENEKLFLDLLNAPERSRAVFITGSGTSSMEAVVMGVLSSDDRAIVIDGGSFGHRFNQLCDLHGIPHDAVCLAPGESLTDSHLRQFSDKKPTAVLVNLCETSTGVLYDLGLLSSFCREKGALLIVDAVSAFLADDIDMTKYGVDVVITGSQKALALPPGISLIACSPRAINRIESIQPKCMYLDLQSALKNGERGQTPFTPAVGILLQLNARLHQIEDAGGYAVEHARIADQARDFRSRIADFPFDMLPTHPSNAVTALKARGFSAKRLFETLKDEYGIWICPNGGDLAESVFRIGHIGALSANDNEALVQALESLRDRGFFEER